MKDRCNRALLVAVLAFFVSIGHAAWDDWGDRETARQIREVAAMLRMQATAKELREAAEKLEKLAERLE